MRLSKLLVMLLLVNPFLLRANGNGPVIKKIIVSGNKFVKKEAILSRLPYKEGDVFDADKSGQAIHHLYGLGSFRQVTLEREELADREIALHKLKTMDVKVDNLTKTQKDYMGDWQEGT